MEIEGNTQTMKKTGLLTWFSYNNYGTVLQLYALNRKISGLGFQNEIINYIPKAAYKEALIVRIKNHPFFMMTEILKRIKNKYAANFFHQFFI
jgi:hypothetical protein